ncbi:SymE family type I addiction module toxin [Pectobacterium polaris]|uniref:SymE family type I addiction module toxin n=1 Tax=Pectobacterium polaris TaxID=2042057 RepID=UPI00301324AF
MLSRPRDRTRGLGGDSGTLTLAGDWLTLSGLPGQQLMIGVLPGRIIIRAEIGTMLA